MKLSVNGESQVPPGFRFHPTEEELLHYYLRKKVAYKKIDLDVIRDVDLNKLEPWDIQENLTNDLDRGSELRKECYINWHVLIDELMEKNKEKCRIGSTPQNDWYFFSHKDKKYPTGTRTNRATVAGFWKATGRDKVIYSNSKRIGMRKTLVFYKGRAPHGLKSDWIMHEYRLLDHNDEPIPTITHASGLGGDDDEAICSAEDGWVVCRVFKKKNYLRAVESSQNSCAAAATTSTTIDSRNLTRHGSISISTSASEGVNDGILDRILVYMGRSCEQENGLAAVAADDNNNPLLHAKSTTSFMHLPRLLDSSPHHQTPIAIVNGGSSAPFGACKEQQRPMMNDCHDDHGIMTAHDDQDDHHNHDNKDPGSTSGRLTKWVALDRLVASQLNATAHVDPAGGREEMFGFPPPLVHDDHQDNTNLTNLRSSNTATCDISSCDQQDSMMVMMMMGNHYPQEDFWSFAGSTSSSSSDHPSLCHLSV